MSGGREDIHVYIFTCTCTFQTTDVLYLRALGGGGRGNFGGIGSHVAAERLHTCGNMHLCSFLYIAMIDYYLLVSADMLVAYHIVSAH